MTKLIFATQNINKLKELAAVLPAGFQLSGLQETTINEELSETGTTLDANALQKARYVFAHTGLPCFADDTGLEVVALDGAPGVYSARYAGEARSAADNMTKLLRELDGKADRRAQFRTVIAWVDGAQELFFEGLVTGTILTEQRGDGGFGYDPIFLPDGFDRSFAEMNLEEKNTISHRARAFAKLLAFLNTK